jgi:hypothetical protein
MPEDALPPRPEPGPTTLPVRGADLARELTGDLPCARCGYNLRSMSIRGVCPECGTPVRATILAKVDPYAEVLRPLSSPRLTVTGLLLLTFGAFACAALTWAVRGHDAAGTWESTGASAPLVSAAIASLGAAALGALLVARPHAGLPVRNEVLAVAGAACLMGLAVMFWRIEARFDPVHTRPYVGGAVLGQRAVLRLAAGALAAAAALLLRPNLRLLASRSVMVRMGRVDRQTVYVMVLAIGVAAAGDAAHIAAALSTRGRPNLELAGTLAIALGSALLTVGLAGLAVDAVRLAPVLLRPPLSMAAVVGPGPTGGGSLKAGGSLNGGVKEGVEGGGA